MELSDDVKYILKKSAEKSIEFNQSIVMPEHILYSILMINDNPRLITFINSKNITMQLISNYLEENKKEPSGDDIVLDEQVIMIFKNAKQKSLNEHNKMNDEYIVYSIFDLGENLAFNNYIKNLFPDTDFNLICQELDLIMDPKKYEKIYSQLESYSTNLNQKFLEGKLPEIYFREVQVSRLTENLLKIDCPNTILIGESGVGKKSVVYKLVDNICNNNIHERLKNVKIFSLNMLRILTSSLAESEANIDELVDLCSNNENIVLFVDNLYYYGGYAGLERNESVKYFLNKIIDVPKIKLIISINNKEYEKYINTDEILNSKFSTIIIEPTTKEETIQIIKNRRSSLKQNYNLSISDECIERIVHFSDKYIKNEYLPSKALKIVDACFSKYLNTYGSVSNNEKKLMILEKEKNELQNQIFSSDDEEKIKKLNYQISKIKTYINHNGQINFTTIDKVLSEKLNIKAKNFLFDNSKKIDTIESNIKRNFIKNENIINSICNQIKNNLKNPYCKNMPIGKFLFCGPEATGKSTLTELIAENFLDSQENIIEIDLENKKINNSLSKISSTSFDNTNFIYKINNLPYSILLIHNIDKAESFTLYVINQILKKGSITDSNDKLIDFSNSLIIATTSFGTRSDEEILNIKNALLINSYESFIKNKLSLRFGEMLENFDDIFYFKPYFDTLTIIDILKLKLDKLRIKIKNDYNIELKFTSESLNLIIEKIKQSDENLGIPYLDSILSEISENLINKLKNQDNSNYSMIIYGLYNNQINIFFK